jgi:hypothetical protein
MSHPEWPVTQELFLVIALRNLGAQADFYTHLICHGFFALSPTYASIHDHK